MIRTRRFNDLLSHRVRYLIQREQIYPIMRQRRELDRAAARLDQIIFTLNCAIVLLTLGVVGTALKTLGVF